MTNNNNNNNNNENRTHKNGYETKDDMIDFFKSHVIVCGIPTNKKEE